MISITQPVPEFEKGAVAPQLHSILRRQIVAGDLPPSTRVSETEIAAAYDVSRQPVREAFIKLAEENLVIVRPQRGTFVKRISVPAVLTTRFIREAVEADIVRRVAENSTPEITAALDVQIGLQREAATSGGPEKFMRLDKDFHRLLADFAGEPEVSEHLRSLNTQIDRVRNLSARQFKPDRLVKQHALVVDAIRARDAATTDAVMRDHLREILIDLPSIVEANPEYFDGVEVLE